MAKPIKIPKDAKELPVAIVKQMLSLATSGFGLVAALAWNEFVKEGISKYIKPYLPEESGIISLFVYAMIVTALAVTVTLQLTKLQQALEKKNEEVISKKNNDSK
jgi:F0F1-type ATP synthase membrane subunit a